MGQMRVDVRADRLRDLRAGVPVVRGPVHGRTGPSDQLYHVYRTPYFNLKSVLPDGPFFSQFTEYWPQIFPKSPGICLNCFFL